MKPFFDCFNLSLTPKIKIPILRKSCEFKQERASVRGNLCIQQRYFSNGKKFHFSFFYSKNHLGNNNNL